MFSVSVLNNIPYIWEKIPKWQIEIFYSENWQDHDQQNETKNKHRTDNTTLKTKAGITRTLQKPGWVQVLRKSKQLLQ